MGFPGWLNFGSVEEDRCACPLICLSQIPYCHNRRAPLSSSLARLRVKVGMNAEERDLMDIRMHHMSSPSTHMRDRGWGENFDLEDP
jgi:hypothetical protein